ncbi:hypothetical protein IscW_ISCW014425 [Ixodes scapularis]|uniref:Uncharacterized protein n=1 Tax=Ixodes scapularis TaxID=6945 RepID=B7QLR2_IXOSC|nr:hypothetical protein IscW_ISCW014425 [Ixodes scapularis]|eukprot:XP_002416117.1 hypothetical protein IscW_ISCW014425 [Ixodes scapularis]
MQAVDKGGYQEPDLPHHGVKLQGSLQPSRHDPGSPQLQPHGAPGVAGGAKLKKRPLCRFWKLRFLPSSSSCASSSSRSKFVAILVLLAALVLVAVVSALVYTLYTRSKLDLRKEEIRQDPEVRNNANETSPSSRSGPSGLRAAGYDRLTQLRAARAQH